MTNSTITGADDGEAFEQLMLIVLMGLVLLCGCCYGAIVCYKENQNTERWSNWVKAKKRGDPTVLV